MADEKRTRGPGRTTREDWLATAMDTLVSEGVDSVKVLTLAEKLDCARSSFYWFFKNRSELLDALLDHWQNTNTKALIDAANLPAATINEALGNLYSSWTVGGDFDVHLDFAIRDWARRSGTVRRALDISDTARIDAIAGMFRRFGYPASEADVRGRIVYFTQIGYATLDQRESWETRISRSRDYLFCMTGVQPTEAETQALITRTADLIRSAER
jgi:AcrR family transcriptional regulator